MSTFSEVRTSELAKDKRTARRGQITKDKLKLVELKAKSLDSISSTALQSLLTKLKRDLLLHEAIQQRYEELLSKEESDATLIEEEEQSTILVSEEHQELLCQLEEFRDCVDCSDDFRKLRARFSMFISAMDAENPGFETDCTPFRTAFNEMMDRILSINANELDCVKKEVEDLQCHLLGKIRESRNIIHSRATPSSTPSTVLPVVTAPRGPKIKLDLPDFNGNPTEWRHFHRLFTSAMTSRGSEFSNHEKVCILLKSMKTAEAQRIVQSHVNSDSCYDEAMEALTAKYGSSRKVFPLLVSTAWNDRLH